MLGRVSWCQVMGGLYIASLHTFPLILHWSVFYWWVPLIPISCSFQSFILLYFTTQNWQYWHYILPQRKIIKWITLFLFVRPADQNITLGIACSYRWLLAKNIQRQYEKTQFVKTGFISAIKLSAKIKQLQHEIFPEKIFIQNYFPFALNKLFPYLRGERLHFCVN